MSQDSRIDPSLEKMSGDSEKARRDFEKAFVTSP
jgi:hypothetical protein